MSRLRSNRLGLGLEKRDIQKFKKLYKISLKAIFSKYQFFIEVIFAWMRRNQNMIKNKKNLWKMDKLVNASTSEQTI